MRTVTYVRTIPFQELEERKNVLEWEGRARLEIPGARFKFSLIKAAGTLHFLLKEPFLAKIFRINLLDGRIHCELEGEGRVHLRGFIRRWSDLTINGSLCHTLVDRIGSPLGWPGFEGDKWWGDLYIVFNRPDEEERKNLQLAVYYSETDRGEFLLVSYFGPPRKRAEYFLAIDLEPLKREASSLEYFIPEREERLEELPLH